jgi:hypothetical protein
VSLQPVPCGRAAFAIATAAQEWSIRTVGGKADMSASRIGLSRNRGLIPLERALGFGVSVAIVVAVSLFFFQARGAMRLEATTRLAGELTAVVRSAHRMSDRGLPDAPGMAAYLAAADAVPSKAVYEGDNPACSAAAPWGGCIEMTSEVTGDAEYLTFTFHDIPRSVCRRLMVIGPDGANALPGQAMTAQTSEGPGTEPRIASFPIDAGSARDLCRGAESATIRLFWAK